MWTYNSANDAGFGERSRYFIEVTHLLTILSPIGNLQIRFSVEKNQTIKRFEETGFAEVAVNQEGQDQQQLRNIVSGLLSVLDNPHVSTTFVAS